jgi:glycerol-3-phosphate dehydrogenase (NAD(P)+)
MSIQVSVIGGGSWGTALTVLLARAGRHVTLWKRNQAEAEEMTKTRENRTYLPGIVIPANVTITSDLQAAVTASSNLIIAVPSQPLREVVESLKPYVTADYKVLSIAKGLEVHTLLRMTQVLAQVLPYLPSGQLAQLAGPNHAEEAGAGLPTTAVVAATDLNVAEKWQEILMMPTLRVYTNHDVVGVELGSSLKQIIAIAAGICDGLGYGDNTKAALLTRGLAEIARLGVALGAQPLTFAGLSGMGDLIVTCTSKHSRNARAGQMIAKGYTVSQVQSATRMVIEGIPTCQAAVELARRVGVEMPITNAVHQVLFEGRDPRTAVHELMMRGPKAELAVLFGN